MSTTTTMDAPTTPLPPTIPPPHPTPTTAHQHLLVSQMYNVTYLLLIKAGKRRKRSHSSTTPGPYTDSTSGYEYYEYTSPSSYNDCYYNNYYNYYNESDDNSVIQRYINCIRWKSLCNVNHILLPIRYDSNDPDMVCYDYYHSTNSNFDPATINQTNILNVTKVLYNVC